MPKIRFEATNFPTYFPPPPMPADVEVSRLQLAVEAMRVGASENVGGPRRRFPERLWRATMVWAFLEERDLHGDLVWARSQAFVDLDPSEKTSVSFLLGLVQASVLTKRLLGLSDVVHVDSLLELCGIPRTGRRPDLVGFDPALAVPGGYGRVLIESKGRSEATGSVVRAALQSAKEQLEEFDDDGEWNRAYALIGANPVLVASVGHFTRAGYWNGHLDDPPPMRDDQPPRVGERAFEGLLNLASLRSVVDTIAEIREYAPARFNRTNGMTFARLPGINMIIGLPTQIYDEVATITGTDRPISDYRAARWAQDSDGRAEIVETRRQQISEDYSEAFADFYLDKDGVLAASLPPFNNGDDNAAPDEQAREYPDWLV